MAVTGQFEVRFDGSDTANGGFFVPTGAGMATNGSVTSGTTSAPVFHSATYTFVAGDVGHWVFIKSGTNWIPGWYQIASVAGGDATLTAGLGTGFLCASGGGMPTSISTATGCVTGSYVSGTASATWAIDYSQSATAAISLTGLTTAAANAIILTSSATVAMAGNTIQITGGTNFTVGLYTIIAVSSGVSITVDRTCTSAAGATGTAGLGGALATYNQSQTTQNGSSGFIKYNASPIPVAATITGGSNQQTVIGYSTNRHCSNEDTQPTLQITASSVTIFGQRGMVHNLIIDGNSQTTSGAGSAAYNRCKFINLTVAASGFFTGCLATGNTANIFGGSAAFCEAYGNTATPFGSNAWYCLAYNNTGATTDGFLSGASAYIISNCHAYNNGRDGFRPTSSRGALLVNCHAENNAGYGFNLVGLAAVMVNCSHYNNTSGGTTGASGQIRTLAPAGSVFTNAGSNDFSLNNTASAGALLRAAGFATFLRGTTVGYPDIGAVQHQDSGSGGGGMPPIYDGVRGP